MSEKSCLTLFTTAIAQVTAYFSNDVGLGVLIPVGATINFTGHSLGGQVANDASYNLMQRKTA